jgi:apolipoprotein N-acyltransferase
MGNSAALSNNRRAAVLPGRLAVPAALLAGGLSALGYAPLGLWPLGLIGLALLLWLVAGAAARGQAFAIAWGWGIGHFAVALNWIAFAFTFQAKMPAALGWLAVVGLAAYLALFVAVPAVLALSAGPDRAARMLALAGFLVPAEWLRGLLLTGFAWNPFGLFWLPLPGMAQLAAVIGGLGLSLLALLAALAMALLAGGRRGRLAAGGIAVALVAAGLAGSARLVDTTFVGAPLVVVQPGIGQGERYDAAAAERHLATYLALTRRGLDQARANARATLPDASIAETPDTGAEPATGIGSAAPALPPGAAGTGSAPGAAPADAALPGGGGSATQAPTLVLWPEGAIDGLVESDAPLRARLAAALGPGDLLLAGGTGIARAGDGTARYANSLFVIDSAGRVQGRYDKAHLVPLGEYVPQRALLEPLGIARLVPGDTDFAAGPGPRTLALPGFLGVSPVICYEIAFPSAVVNEAVRPAWIANVSNDAWFGAWGPPQHLAQAQLRAIEEGLPIARATPTGISAVIDGNGRIRIAADAGADVIATTLPAPLPAPPFVNLGPVPALMGALVLAAAALLVMRRQAD